MLKEKTCNGMLKYSVHQFWSVIIILCVLLNILTCPYSCPDLVRFSNNQAYAAAYLQCTFFSFFSTHAVMILDPFGINLVNNVICNSRELDAFIYDGTVLNFLASQDDECRLLQVNVWEFFIVHMYYAVYYSIMKAN